MDRTLLHQLMYYEYSLGTSAPEAARKINSVYGEGTVTDRTVRNWYHRFENGDTSLQEQPKSGRPSKFDENALKEALEANPTATTRELAKVLGYGNSTVERHLQSMGYRKILDKWTLQN
uniref:HTH_48 domain-containing protein n=1 Tax=Panagrellus redivivus TaxID=6233 RepID=A0A7E4V7Y4_PANRE